MVADTPVATVHLSATTSNKAFSPQCTPSVLRDESKTVHKSPPATGLSSSSSSEVSAEMHRVDLAAPWQCRSDYLLLSPLMRTVCSCRHGHSRPDSYHQWSSRRATGDLRLNICWILVLDTVEIHVLRVYLLLLFAGTFSSTCCLLRPAGWAMLSLKNATVVVSAVQAWVIALILTAGLCMFRHPKHMPLPPNLAEVQMCHTTPLNVRPAHIVCQFLRT